MMPKVFTYLQSPDEPSGPQADPAGALCGSQRHTAPPSAEPSGFLRLAPLFVKANCCLATGGQWEMVDRHTGQVIAAAAGEMPGPPLFWWQLPDSDLRKILRETLECARLDVPPGAAQGVMALQLSNEAPSDRGRCANDILRMADAATGPPRAARHLHAGNPFGAMPRRAGRGKGFGRHGAVPAREHPLVIALQRAGHQPGHYSTKMEFRLEPEMAAPAAARIILKYLARIMRCNEEGSGWISTRNFSTISGWRSGGRAPCSRC